MKRLKFVCIWLLMIAKRYWKKPMFVMTILMIPVLVLTLRFTTGKDEAAIRVALYAYHVSENELALVTIENLIEESGSIISFYEVDSEEALYENVRKGYASCGYVFPEDFEEAVKNYVKGKKGKLPFDGAMLKCIRKDETNVSKVSDEIVFSSFYKCFADEVLLNFMLQNEKSGTNEMTEDDITLLETYRNSYPIHSKLFQFEFLDGRENVLLNEESTSFLLLPVRGMILALILLAAMTGGIMVYQDREKGMFQRITIHRRGIISFFYILIPTLLCAIVGLVGIFFAGVFTDLKNELITMGCYVFFVTSVSNLLRVICREINLFVSVIPIFLMLNIIFCPVFIDLSAVLPEIASLERILPVSYGLNGLYDSSTKIVMLTLAVIFSFTIIAEFIFYKEWE